MTEYDTTASALLELGAATLGESGGHAMRARIRAAWSGARVAAPAFPVRCTPGDNLAIHVAVAEAPAGHTLVVDVGDVPELGYWGEVLTTGAQARGLAGLVIDGGVRDVAALEAHGFPVFSTMIALRGATKNQAGAVGGSTTRRRHRRVPRRLDRRRRRRCHGRARGRARRRTRRGPRPRDQGRRVLRGTAGRRNDDGAARPRRRAGHARLKVGPASTPTSATPRGRRGRRLSSPLKPAVVRAASG